MTANPIEATASAKVCGAASAIRLATGVPEATE